MILALLALAAAPGPVRIHDIQGRSHVSPRAGDTVAGVPGVVTAVADGGFWMQDPEPDGDPATSEGVFVAREGRRTVGEAVEVDGKVAEVRPGDDATNLTTTQIAATSVTRAAGAGAGRSRIAATSVTRAAAAGTVRPTRIGAGGRRPPLRVIEDDAHGDVEAAGVRFDPREDGLDFHESLEGMLVAIARPQVAGPRTSFGELPVLARGAARLRTRRGGVLVRRGDFNPERLILDDELARTPTANVGDRLAGPVRAVVGYSFGGYKYLVTTPPRRVNRRLRRERTQRPRRAELAIASMNVENLSATDPRGKFARLARIVARNLRGPDILAVEEMQDDDGAPAEGDARAGRTFRRLVAAIHAAGGPRYRFRQIDPRPGADGGEPGGNIRVGFLFRTDRGLRFVDRGTGDATTPTSEDGRRRGAQLTLSPGRIQPRSRAFAGSRKPLAAQFRWRGRTLFAIANHFNSKGGDQPLFGRFQPPRRSSEAQRHAQARAVRDFVRSLLRADRQARIAVVGDFNDFEFSRTLAIVESGGLANLMERLPRNQRYSYVFDGNSQTLDQILVSRALARARPEYDSVHVNAEFADQASDHDPQVARVVVR